MRSKSGAIGLMISATILGIGLATDIDLVSSQDRNLRWDRFDVRIDNIDTTANQFDVAEMYELTIVRGPYTFGFVDIPMNRLTDITHMEIYQDSSLLAETCSDQAGTYCVTREDGDFFVKYYFLRPAQSGDQLSIQVNYTVHGALRSYEEGDELFWVALPEDLSGFDVEASRVIVVMPQATPALYAISYPQTWQQVTEGNTITWFSPPRPSDDGKFEVRVKYPHNPAMKKPSWQRCYDLQQTFSQWFQAWKDYWGN
jgi:hypothetical protein